jgi:FkbM family methyltransferase
MFTSYAQNFEDVMLWRALKHVQSGTYVDVGAQHPVIDSVSLAFYERGWRGVHVEPVPAYADLLRRNRPDEVVIQAALDAKQGLLSFFDIEQSGLSTADEDIAKRHRNAGFEVREIAVPSLTLDDVLAGLADKDVHWLKIDVEGYERQVLEGWSSGVEPWVIVIESTLPLTQTEAHQDWEPLLLGRGYRFAYLDGINRFYVAPGHLDLLAAFQHGPNYFDGFTLGEGSPYCDALNATITTLREQGQMQVAEAVAGLEGELTRFRAQVGDLHGKLDVQQVELARREGELSQLRSQGDALLERLVASELRAARFEGEAALAHADLAEANSQLKQQGEELAETRTRVHGLSDELNASEHRADQATRSSHHWWTVAVGLGQELATMRGSRSWRITSPLRAVSSLFGRTGRLARAGLAKSLELPRGGARRILLIMVSVVQARPGLKAHLARWIAGFPRLEAHLRAFVSYRWHPLRAAQAPADFGLQAMLPSEDPYEASADGIVWAAQPPSVRKVYRQLVQARAQAQAEPGYSAPDAAR